MFSFILQKSKLNTSKVNNAGLMSNRNMEESSEYVELMIKVNILGPMLVITFVNIRFACVDFIQILR